jgi:hypothetical protein
MVKKFTLFLLLGIIGLTTNLFAQQDASIDPADIRYWIGEGENEVVFIVNWNEPDTALAWGYRFNTETVTVKDMMLDIQATDYRFGFVGESFVSDVTFNDGILDLKLAGMWWMYNVNGVTAGEYFNTQTVSNGDWVKFGDESCGTLVDPQNYIYVWTKEVAAVYPLAEEATIDPADVDYWIGEGEKEVVFCVNWNEPDIALAWGFRFEGDYTVETMMNSIENADGRFTYETGDWGVTDIIFDDGEVHYSLVGPYWMYNINGSMAMLGFDQQPINDGDFIKWGDISCATEIAPWTYVWTTPVQPVTIYNDVEEVEALNMAVYPNPATDYIMVEAQSFESVQIYDMTGRLVLTSTESKIDVRSLETGVYFVRVNGNTTKLVVK